MKYSDFFRYNDMVRQNYKEYQEMNKGFSFKDGYKVRIMNFENKNNSCLLSNGCLMTVDELLYCVKERKLCLSNPSVLIQWKGWDENQTVKKYNVVEYKERNTDDLNKGESSRQGKVKVLKQFTNKHEAICYLHYAFWNELCTMQGHKMIEVLGKYGGDMKDKQFYLFFTSFHWEEALYEILDMDDDMYHDVSKDDNGNLYFVSEWVNVSFLGDCFEIEFIEENSAISGCSTVFHLAIQEVK